MVCQSLPCRIAKTSSQNVMVSDSGPGVAAALGGIDTGKESHPKGQRAREHGLGADPCERIPVSHVPPASDWDKVDASGRPPVALWRHSIVLGDALFPIEHDSQVGLRMALHGGALMPLEDPRWIRGDAMARRYMPAKSKRRRRCPRLRRDVTSLEQTTRTTGAMWKSPTMALSCEHEQRT